MALILLRVVFAFGAALGFAILLNIERRKALFAGFGGAFSWLFYELTLLGFGTVGFSLFVGSLAMGLYSEFMARKLQSPATVFYIPGFVPLVPGSNVYFTVQAAAQGTPDEAMAQLFLTLIYSAAIALGLIVASAIVAIYKNIGRTNLKKFMKEVKKEQ